MTQLPGWLLRDRSSSRVVFAVMATIPEDLLRNTFAEFDKDGNGYLTADELVPMLELVVLKHRIKISKKEIMEICEVRLWVFFLNLKGSLTLKPRSTNGRDVVSWCSWDPISFEVSFGSAAKGWQFEIFQSMNWRGTQLLPKDAWRSSERTYAGTMLSASFSIDTKEPFSHIEESFWGAHIHVHSLPTKKVKIDDGHAAVFPNDSCAYERTVQSSQQRLQCFLAPFCWTHFVQRILSEQCLEKESPADWNAKNRICLHSVTNCSSVHPWSYHWTPQKNVNRNSRMGAVRYFRLLRA